MGARIARANTVTTNPMPMIDPGSRRSFPKVPNRDRRHQESAISADSAGATASCNLHTPAWAAGRKLHPAAQATH